MKDCMAPKSQPAGPACCLRDCKLSLRMQTDKQDRHHLPILPSTAETVVHTAPSPPPLFSILSPFPDDFFFILPAHMHVYELPHVFSLSSFSPCFLSVLRLFPSDGMSQLAVYIPSHCLMVCLPLYRR